MPQTFYVLAAFLGFGFIIFIHELGHFLAAKFFKVKVKAFSLGFPPTILHHQVGETDYRLGLIPMGGYVSMVGEDPTEKTDDPRALSSILPWKRAVVFLAGVTMNVISAMVIYGAASFIGIEVLPPVVGEAEKDSPAQLAGLQSGDRILTIDGSALREFEDIRFGVALGYFNDPNHIFAIRYLRDGQVLTANTKAEKNDQTGMPQLGVAPPSEPLIKEVDELGSAAQIGFKAGDRIVAVAGQTIRFAGQLDRLLIPFPEPPFTITVERDGRQVALPVDPQKLTSPSYGLKPPLYIAKVTPDGVAEKAGIKAGDYILKINDRSYPDQDDFSALVQKAEGQAVTLYLLRDGTELPPITVSGKFDPTLKRQVIGVSIGDTKLAEKYPILVHVRQTGAAAAAGVPHGAQVLRLNGKKTPNWNKLAEHLDKAMGQPIELKVQLPGSKETKTFNFSPRPEKAKGLTGMVIEAETRERLAPIYNPLAAVGLGLHKIKQMAVLQYVSVKALASGEVERDKLNGPITIGWAFYKKAEAGLSQYMMFLGLVSVAIALLNVMPVPPLDGGHVLFLAVEKVIRRPVPIKVREVVTIIGLVALLGLVGLALSNDIIAVYRMLFL